MDENTNKLTVLDKKDGPEKVNQTSDTSNKAVLNRRRRATITTVQHIFLASLNSNEDGNNNDCLVMGDQFQRVVNDLIIFTDENECLEAIENMSDSKVCMIIPGDLGQYIVPLVHSMFQVDSIFIFCNTHQSYESWFINWSKVKGIFTEITLLCTALYQANQRCERNAISITIMTTNDDLPEHNLDRIDSSFMYTQIIKEILLTMKFEIQHINEFTEYCRYLFPRTNNKDQLKYVNELEQNYRNKTSIWWYTTNSFLYSMLNNALRLMDVEHLIKMGFFINDLHHNIEQLHKEQFTNFDINKSFTVYRGQGLYKKEFQKLEKAKNGFISFNNFLSTSYDRDVAYLLSDSNQHNPDLVGIFFVMTINPSKSTTPFASVKHLSNFQNENEVLFSMHTVFRIVNIISITKNHFQIDLILTDEHDEGLRILTDRIREETFPNETGWYRLGSLLLKMGEFDEAGKIYEMLFTQTTDNSNNNDEKGRLYHRLGLVKYNQGRYKEALRLYKKSLTIRQESLSSNSDVLANSYNNIGLVYKKIHDYSKALASHGKALEIQQQLHPPNHLHIASSYTNIGNVYYNMGQYMKALSFHEKALTIKEQELPTGHPDFSSSYSSIGNALHSMGEYSKAVSSHEKAILIQQQVLPPNHPHLATSYNNIGNVYYSMGEYLKALSAHEKALVIREQILSFHHPDLCSSYTNIGFVYEKIGEYSKAYSFFERAVVNGEQRLSINHSILQQRRKNLERIKKKL